MRTRVAAMAGLLALAACSSPPWPADTVVLVVESPPETLDRRLALSAVAENVAGGLLEPGLVRIGEDGRPVPELAESFAQPDPTTVVFTLRPSLRFSDGSPLVASDVAATFQTLGDPRLASPLAMKYREIERIETPDDRTVVVHLAHPFAPILGDLQLGIVPARREAAPGRDDFGRHPVGAGPFRFESWPDEEHLLLAANPWWWRGRPAIGHLLVKTVRDETTRALELRSGEADVGINTISPPILRELAKVPTLDVLSEPGADTVYLMFQMGDPALADERVREALSLAIDRAAIVRYKYLGHARLADSVLPPGNWAHAPGLPSPGRDLSRARALLAQGGFGGPGQPRLAVTLETSTDRFRRSVGEVIVSELAEAGVDARLRSLEFGTFFSDIRKGSFQLAVLKWVPIFEPDLLYWLFASPSIPTLENGWAGGNRERWRDAATDAVLTDARETTDPAKRAALYASAQRRLAEGLPYFPLWNEDSVAVVSKRLAGFRLSAFGWFDGLAQARVVRP